MKRILNFLLLFFLTLHVFAQTTTYFGPGYVHLNTGANCFFNYTILDGTVVGNDPSDMILFSHVWGVGGTHSEYLTRSCGLWYTGSDWSIFDETMTTMDTNFAYNVLNANQHGTGFIHTVTADNLIDNFSLIDDPLLNGHPEKLFFISKTWDNGVYDTAHVGIWYYELEGKWTIYNEAAYPQTLQINSTYNIFVPDEGTSYIKHVATDGSYLTPINDPRLNNHPDARVFAVHDYTNTSPSAGYINDELGVYYDGTYWMVYTENGTSLWEGATFNVLIAAEFASGIQGTDAENKTLKVFPNPARDEFTIVMNTKRSSEEVPFNLTTMDGRIMKTGFITKDPQKKNTVNVNDLPAGLYFLHVTTLDEILTAKVFVTK